MDGADDEQRRTSYGESRVVAPYAGADTRVDRGDEPVRQSRGLARLARAREGGDRGGSMAAWLRDGTSRERHRRRELWVYSADLTGGRGRDCLRRIFGVPGI